MDFLLILISVFTTFLLFSVYFLNWTHGIEVLYISVEHMFTCVWLYWLAWYLLTSSELKNLFDGPRCVWKNSINMVFKWDEDDVLTAD